MLDIVGLLRRLYRPVVGSLGDDLSKPGSEPLGLQSQVGLIERESDVDTVPASSAPTTSIVLSKEKLETVEFAAALELFIGFPRCFTLKEFVDWLDAEVDWIAIKQSLIDDPRLIWLGSQECDDEYFIPETALFRWWSQLSLRLAQAQQTTLTQHQLAMGMSSLRLDGRWDTPPDKAVDFGQQFGFVAAAWHSEQYVFPLAHVLSQVSPVSTKLVSAILETFSDAEKWNIMLRQPLSEAITLGLSKFDGKIAGVVQGREGLLTGTKMTLEQIGAV